MTQKDRLIALLDSKVALLDLADSNSIGTIEKIDELADYLIANGVIVPPCKVGQIVFSCMSFESDTVEIVKGEVETVSLQSDGLWVYCRFECGLLYWYPIKFFVKNIYFTEKEAKKALAERKESK